MSPAPVASQPGRRGDGADGSNPLPAPHRAEYIFERGVWRVSCRVCRWEATGPVRRQLASRFRFHLRSGQDVAPDARRKGLDGKGLDGKA